LKLNKGRKLNMKKFLIGLVMLFVFATTLPLTAEAHNGCPRHRKAKRSYASRNYYAAPRYRTAGYSYQRPSFYRRHRNLINVGAATGVGALLGGLIGGKRGLGYGALIGAGSGAVYTYGIRPKKRRY
jgi:hypothetical protein